ncbi:diacylglycerol kinase family protein [Hymenobacter sp. B81]|uniref:diacylglycerol kinase family protein n=1 Tax=Hymenobacter sp. B81 TaxID=3344878 RepID=UPI0037DD6642
MAEPPLRPGRPWQRELASFGFALKGIRTALTTEPHLRFHALAAGLVVAVGLGLPLTRHDWALLALAIGAVWTAELLNTALETLVNLVSPEFHPLAGRVKDVAAGAVLVTALAAAAVGLLVLGPPLWAWALSWLS